MTPTITFVNESVAESLLRKTTVYRYYPESLVKEEILRSVKEHLNSDLTEYDNVEIKIEIILKTYDKKPDKKKFWYDDKLKKE